MALLLALIALTTFSALGIYMSFNSATEVRISDNYESREQARQAALAGIEHARELLRGLDFNDLLKGPDGTFLNTSSYITLARTMPFRNPVAWATARTLNIADPSAALGGTPDDGILNTGKSGTTNGTSLIGLNGIVQTSPNPYGSGNVITSRYFVKVTDNNGEATELAGDGADNPFVDGDKVIIVRSLGIARTIADGAGASTRSNSVAVFEARFRRTTTFDLDAPLLVEAPNLILPSSPNMFDGNAFGLHGGNTNLGIATIDTDRNLGPPLPGQITGNLSQNQRNNIQGVGGPPSVGDITLGLTAEQQQLTDPNYLWTFATTEVPLIADSYYSTSQQWSGGNAPDLGSYDYRLSPTDDRQHPKVVYVDGDLNVSGNVSGGGILVVRGKLTGSGTFTYNGLILVLGQGEMDLSGLNMGVHGGVWVANVTESNGTATFGTPRITMSGNSDIYVDSAALRVARQLLPIRQLGLREITSRTDP